MTGVQTCALPIYLVSNSSLNHINLNINNIGFEGYFALREAEKVNKNIGHIYLIINECAEDADCYQTKSITLNTSKDDSNGYIRTDSRYFVNLINSGVTTLKSEEEYLLSVPLLHDIEINNSPKSFKKACTLYNAAKIRKAGDVIIGEIGDDLFSIVQEYMGSSKFSEASSFLDLIFSQQPSLMDFLRLPESVQKYAASKITNFYKKNLNLTEVACTNLVPLLHEIEISDFPQFQKESAHYNAAKIRETTKTIIDILGNDPISIVQQYMGSEKFAAAITSLDSIFSPQSSAKDFSNLSKHVKDYIVASLNDAFLKVCKAYLATTTESISSSSAKIMESSTTSSDLPLEEHTPDITDTELTGATALSDID